LAFDSVDVAIVGCGVSGAATAIASAQSGATVAVFEEHSSIGEPSHCSGHVGIFALRRFAPPIPRRIIENEIKGAVFNAPDGRQLILRRNEPVTWVLNRSKFDKHMASLATSSGAALHLNSRVHRLEPLDNGMIEICVRGNKERKVQSKIVVDAAGCGGSVSRYAGLPQPSREMLVNSAQVSVDEVADIDREMVEVYFGQKYSPGFFGWIIPRRDGSAKIGIAAGSRVNVAKCFEHFIKKHPAVSPKVRKAKFRGRVNYHPIPIGGPPSRTYTDRLLTVGDAASQVKATTGGGIVFGLLCGKIAGQMAAGAVIAGDTSATRLSEYDRSWRKLIGFDMKAMVWLRKLLYRLPDESMNRIFGISSELNVNEVLNAASDIDFQGRTILSRSKDPRLLVTLLSAAVLSAPSLIGRQTRSLN